MGRPDPGFVAFPASPLWFARYRNPSAPTYASDDLERLFEIQPRSAQMLMNLLPAVRVGKSLLVEREALAGFLGVAWRRRTIPQPNFGRSAPAPAESSRPYGGSRATWFQGTSMPG